MVPVFKKILWFLLSLVAVATLILLIETFHGGFIRSVYNVASHVSLNNVGSNVSLNKTTSNVSINTKTYTSEELDELRKTLIGVSKSLQRAAIHVRGIKTAHNIKSATTLMNSALKFLDIKPSEVTVRPVKTSTSVCPEEYKGNRHGYPLYHVGFVPTNCTYGKPMEKLLTVLLHFDTRKRTGLTSVIQTTVRTIRKHHHDVNIFIGTSDRSLLPSNLTDNFTNVHVKEMPKGSSPGKVWNKLLESVQTDYAFIARDLELFTYDARLDRLIREIERLGVDVAAGAYRDTDGHWKIGCHQRALRNSTLVFKEGYDESLHECLFCDHVDGPLIITTSASKKVKFDETIKDNGLFEDFFLRMSIAGREAIVCPDVMFHVAKSNCSNESSQWETFAAKWYLTSLKMSSGKTVDFKCAANFACFPGRGMGVTTCCLQELSKATKYTMDACAEAGILCEVCDGSVMGVVKFSSLLPWERDSDLIFPRENFTAFTKLQQKFKNAGYGFIIEKKKNLMATSKHWHVEIWRMKDLDSRAMLEEGLAPTKVLLDGTWLRGPTNPASFARNRYGREIYKHSEHWGTLGNRDSWVEYAPSTFLSCKTPSHQFCLDNYNADGNMQFRDPIP